MDRLPTADSMANKQEFERLVATCDLGGSPGRSGATFCLSNKTVCRAALAAAHGRCEAELRC